MKVTECLNTEHGVFLSQLRVLEKMLAGNAGAEELRAATLPIAETVERHRQAEETIFYPAILKACAEDAPIEEMEAEHREVERCIQAIVAREGDIAAHVRSFIDTLRRHIAREIQVLFPMAEQRIPQNELEHMTRECIEYYHAAAGVNPQKKNGS